MKHLVLWLCTLCAAGCSAGGLRDGYFKVKRALSGDTIELETGEVIRYAGILAPVAGQPFFEESRLRNDQFVVGRDVRVELVLLKGRKDSEGRAYALALVPAQTLRASVMVNTEILQSGLAKIDYKTMPTGRESFFEERQEFARRRNLGIWSDRR
ncbi:MAG: thermonuclease family protein [Planctomycetota bacterium]